MNIFVGIVIGLLVGGILAWFIASSKAKLSFERAIRDIEGKAKGAEASRDAVQRQAAIFQEEIVTLKAQVEKLQSERLQIEGAIKASEARQISHQQTNDECIKKISLLEETSESLRVVNADQKFQLSMAGERLTFTQQNFEQSQEDISKLKEDLQKLQSENANLQIAISVADNTRENSQESINSHRYQEETTALKAQVERLSENNEKLLAINNEQKSQLTLGNDRLVYARNNYEQSQIDIAKLKVSHKNQFETFKREKNEEITILRRQHQQVISGMTDTFKSLASDILKQESQEFRANANEDFTRRQESIEGIVQPVQENLVKLEKEIRELEKERIGSYHELKNQVDSLIKLETSLRQETGNLVQALKQPTGRGQWGEVVLEKVLELSGMIEGKHYDKQVSTSSNDGVLRPDIIVNLPNKRKLVIDAKAVMSAISALC